MTEVHPPAGPGHDAIRDVFRDALRSMLVLVAVVTVLGVTIGWFVAGTAGVWGAVIGAAVTLLFSGTTVVSMLITSRSSATTTAGVVLGAWLGKMVVLVVVLALLQGRDFVDRVVFVVVLLVGVLGSMLLDLRAVRRGRVPYTDPGSAATP